MSEIKFMEVKAIKDYYTTIQTAKLLGVSVRTVQLWVENGELEAWKTAGGHRRIVISSVENYLTRHKSSESSLSSDVKRILIVEDNPTVAKFYQAAISSWKLPIEVVVAEDGFNGLIEIGRRPPDLLVSDIYMPGMDGLQMIRSLYKSAQLSGDRIVVISGLTNEEIAERGGVPNEVTFFSKPVDIQGFKEIVLNKLRLS